MKAYFIRWMREIRLHYNMSPFKPGNLIYIRFPDRLTDCRLGIILSYGIDRYDKNRYTGIEKTVPACLHHVYDIEKNEYIGTIHFAHLEKIE